MPGRHTDCHSGDFWQRIEKRRLPKFQGGPVALINYRPSGFDEMFTDSGEARDYCTPYVDRLRSFEDDELGRRQAEAEVALHNLGITFNVYGHDEGTEKVWPFDVLPRVIDEHEWNRVEAGLKQRVRALNHFVDDVYNQRHIMREGLIPSDLIESASAYRSQMRGFSPKHQAWCHISGVDLVRDADGTIYVLEDNVRCPSGVSYVLENREIMKRTFPQVFDGMAIRTVEEYPERLLNTLLACAPDESRDATAVVLTPGIYNSAYFEHTFLAQQMGVQLVQGPDLFVEDGLVFMRTTRGPKRVDVIYRRIDDDFLDPNCFREDSCLGIPGLMDVYRSGRVSLANAPGTGIADDKAVYAYVPAMIRFYLAEDPILENVPTYLCSDETQKKHVLANLDKLVVKPTGESGGYGILIGPAASIAERELVADRVRRNPRGYVAQPMLNLSTVPTLVDGELHPRHVDLRPFVLCSDDVYVMPGGLTRVALEEGSMVVNSSQGGGSKDTWVLRGTGSMPPPAPKQNFKSADPIVSQAQTQ